MDKPSVPIAAAPKYLPALDGVRGIAVLLVLWAHLPHAIQPGFIQPFLRVAQLGYMGVNLFFVLSGFLITRILLRDRANGVPLRYFFYRRVLRIFPIYFLTIALVGAFRPSMDIAWCAVFLSNFHFAFTTILHPLEHTWTLSVEEQFYLLWPLLVYALPEKVSRRVIGWVVLPLSVLSAVLIVHLVPGFITAEQSKKLIYFATPCEAGALAAGALLAFAERSMDLTRVYVWVASAFIGLLGLMIGIASRPMVSPVAYDAFRLVSYAMMSFAIVATVVAFSSTRLTGWLRASPLRSVGRISFGLYLYHYPIFILLSMYPAPNIARHILLTRSLEAVALSFIAAAISFVLIERPILRLKNRFDFRSAFFKSSPVTPTSEWIPM